MVSKIKLLQINISINWIFLLNLQNINIYTLVAIMCIINFKTEYF